MACSQGLSTLPAQDPALNRNEFTRQLYTAKVWLRFSDEFGPDEFIADGHTDIRQKWKECAVAGKSVTDAWDDALESDPLIQKGIECANNFADRELQAQELRQALRKRYGEKAFDRMEREGKDYQAAWQYSHIDLEDKELVRLSLWAGDLSCRIATKEQPPADTTTNAPAVHGWLAKVEPFDSIVKERGAPKDEEEAVEIFKLGAAAANAVAKSRIEAFQAEHSFEPEMLTYLRLRQQADIFEFMGRNYLRSRLEENEAISQAEAHFQTAIGGLVGELPGLADSIQQFQRKAIEAEVARTVKLYEEHKDKEPSSAPQ